MTTVGQTIPSNGIGLPHIAQGRVGMAFEDLGIRRKNTNPAAKAPRPIIMGLIVIDPVLGVLSNESIIPANNMKQDTKEATNHVPKDVFVFGVYGELGSKPRIQY